MTLRLRIQIAAAAIAIISMAMMAGIGYWVARDELMSSLEERVGAISRTVAAATSAKDLEGCETPEFEKTEQYLALNNWAAQLRAANAQGEFPLRWVYLLTPTKHNAPSGWDTLVDGAPIGSQDWTRPGEPYTAIDLVTGKSIMIPASTPPIYCRDRWGEWLSGFAPVMDAGGRVVALVGADIDHNAVIRELWKKAEIVGAVVLVVAVLLFLVTGKIIARSLQPVDEIRHFIDEVGHGNFGARLALPELAELAVVARDLNAMAMHLAEREKLALENRVLTVDVTRKGEQLDAIARVDVQLQEIQDVDVLIDMILSDARRLLRCDAGSVLLREGDELMLKWVQNDSLSRALPPGQTFRVPIARIPIGGNSIAGYVGKVGHPAVIDDAYLIPDSAPYRFNREVDERTGYRTRAVLAMPLRTGAGKVIGVLQLLNPLDQEGTPRAGFAPDDLDAIHHFSSAATLALERAALTRAIVMRMIRMAELRDPSETAAHVQRVADYSIILYDAWAAKNGIDPATRVRERDTLRIAAMLHDVGKVGIPDAILKKPGRLTVEEYRAMQQHVVIGARLFADGESALDRAALDVVLHHHERWDGAGYVGDIGSELERKTVSNGPVTGGAMAGDKIPLFARIVSVADVYDALGSKRQYKEAWPEDRVVAEIKANSGRQFDPEIVELLDQCLPAFRVVAGQYL